MAVDTSPKSATWTYVDGEWLTGNPPLISLASTIGAGVRWTTHYKQRKRRLPPDPMPEHWRVYDAVAAGDADEARAAMEALVNHALAQISGAMSKK